MVKDKTLLISNLSHSDVSSKHVQTILNSTKNSLLTQGVMELLNLPTGVKNTRESKTIKEKLEDQKLFKDSSLFSLVYFEGFL